MKLESDVTYICLFFLILTFVITYPLVFNLEGVLLPQKYDRISEFSLSDTRDNIRNMLRSKSFLLNLDGDFLITNPAHPVVPTYKFAGIFMTELPYINGIIFHNLYFLFSMFLAGLFTYLLIIYLSKSRLAALLGGIMYMSSNYFFYEYFLGHTNLWQIQWIPLIFLFLEKMIREEKIKYAVYLGVAFSLQLLSSSQYTLYLSLILPIYLLIKIHLSKKLSFLFDKTFLRNLSLAFLTSLSISGLYLVERFSKSGLNPIRSIEINQKSLFVLDSLYELFAIGGNFASFYLIFHLALLFLGAYLLYSKIDLKSFRELVPFLFIFIFSALSAMGPVSPLLPYYWIYKFWPFVDYFRVPFRMLVFSEFSFSLIVPVSLLKASKAVEEKYKFGISAIVFLSVLVLYIIFFSLSMNLHVVY